MATVVCIRVPSIPDALKINLPGVGELQFIKDTLLGIPRPADYILKAMNALSPAFAPIHSLIRIVDVILAVQNCINAIPKAIPFNPAAIINCFKGLYEAILKIIPYVPPFSYVRMVVDIVVTLRALLADIAQALNSIDYQITFLRTFMDAARSRSDMVAVQIGDCSMEDIRRQTGGILQVFELVAKVGQVIVNTLKIMVKVLPGPVSAKVDDLTKDVEELISSLADADVETEDFPPLREMLDYIEILDQILVRIEIIGKGILGMNTNVLPITLPSLQNLDP